MGNVRVSRIKGRQHNPIFDNGLDPSHRWLGMWGRGSNTPIRVTSTSIKLMGNLGTRRGVTLHYCSVVVLSCRSVATS